MSVFIVGERNNIGKENICTSFVFGTMELLDREIFLNGFLKQLDIAIRIEELKSAKFHFWTKIKPENQRIPDVVIELKKDFIYVENKVDSDVDSTQLIEEFEDAKDNTKKDNKKNAFLIYITNDSTEPQHVRFYLEDHLKHEASNVKWYSWKKIDKFISSITKNNSLDSTSIKLLTNLNKYLHAQIVKKPEAIGAIVAINPDIYQDDWLKNVIVGKETIYDSNRVKDLEFPNQKILFYRTKQGIIGEATICNFGYDTDEERYFYDFRYKGKSTFIQYPNEVRLSDLRELGINLIITSVGINMGMYDKIRKLSKLKQS